jgi:hypothetical protein
MKKPLLSIIVIINILFLSCARTTTPEVIIPEVPLDGHPALLIMAKYQQLNDQVNVVIPYIITLYAIDLLKNDPTPNLTLVKAYIDWYLAHLNYPDKYGITGSIYDYRIFADESEESLDSMDSVDSYSATFIMLINQYYEITSNTQFINQNRQFFEDMIFHIPYLMQDDDLTIALPGHEGKYLMDNCESLGGVDAFVQLSQAMGWDSTDYYITIRERLLIALETHLYNPGLNNYDWVIDGTKHSTSSWDNFYPDSYAQLFPILYNITQNISRKQFLWNQFHQVYGSILEDIPIEQRVVYLWTKEVYENEIQTQNNDQSRHQTRSDQTGTINIQTER